MSLRNSRFDWLGGVATALSLVACYGTLAVIGILGVLGITIALNEAPLVDYSDCRYLRAHFHVRESKP